jgi:hypothetical protein
MCQPRGLSLLFLLLLGVPLNVQKGSATPPPSPTPIKSAQATQGEPAQNTEAQNPTPAAIPAQKETSNKTKERRTEHQDVIVVGSVQVARDKWFFGFTILFDFLIALFTGLLWYTSKLQWKATRAALHVNRPFLIVKQPRMKGEPPTSGGNNWIPQCAEIDVENFGTGPADIIDVNCSVEPFDLPPPDPRVEYQGRLSPYIPVIAARETVELMRQYFDLGPLARKVFDEEKRLGVYREIRYRGGPPDEIYSTRFFWWYFVGAQPAEAFARAFTKELNARVLSQRRRRTATVGMRRRPNPQAPSLKGRGVKKDFSLDRRKGLARMW